MKPEIANLDVVGQIMSDLGDDLRWDMSDLIELAKAMRELNWYRSLDQDDHTMVLAAGGDWYLNHPLECREEEFLRCKTVRSLAYWADEIMEFPLGEYRVANATSPTAYPQLIAGTE